MPNRPPPLSDSQIAQIRAEEQRLMRLRIADDQALGWWALAASWALSPAGTLWCVSTATHFLACGGPGWAELGYDVVELAGKPWSAYVANEAEIAASAEVTRANQERGAGFDRFVNTYRTASGGARSVRWRASTWHRVGDQSYAVARGELL